MRDRVTVSGRVEGSPRFVVTDTGLAIASLVLRTHTDPSDRVRLPPGSVPGCLLVTAMDDLARGIDGGVRAGDRLVVGGALIVREPVGGVTSDGTVVAELHAEVIGLDVHRGSSPSSGPRAVDGSGARRILS